MTAASAQELRAAAERIVDVFILAVFVPAQRGSLAVCCFCKWRLCAGPRSIVGFRRLRGTAEQQTAMQEVEVEVDGNNVELKAEGSEAEATFWISFAFLYGWRWFRSLCGE